MPLSQIAFIEDLVNTNTLEELWAKHVAKMQTYGFDRALYGYTMFRAGDNLGDPEDFVILSNHDRTYLDEFFAKRMFMHAPMVKWALENEGTVSWSMMEQAYRQGDYSREELEVVEFNRVWGISVGYSVSFKSLSPRSKAGIGLVGKPGTSQSEVDAIWDAYGKEITLLNNVFHLKVLQLPYSYPNRALTHRQREVLEWVSDGKTTQDIAMLINRTTATVEKHLRLARESLGVQTTAQAVSKATFQNQIFRYEV
ncbi:LuxR family transcriptional regulator [Cognatishimia sp.]|uniref:LuxR family transcriptional regulator n=1 Tax=Cognatishimia sp. TaxID=2211648 RepID=UPI0035194CBA